MTEILFKAKRTDNGKWVEGYYVCLNGTSHRIYTGYAEADCGEYYPDWYEIDKNTLCRYTGLTDKNKEKIWTYDIVDCQEKRGPAFYHCVVVYNEQDAMYAVRNGHCAFPISEYDTPNNFSITGKDYKKVGNIFDHPNLNLFDVKPD